MGELSSSSEVSRWTGRGGIFSKNEELRVTVLNLFLAVIIVSLTATTWKGSGSNGVDNLFSFGCRRRTVSPRAIVFGFALFRLSLFDFISGFFVSSLLRISSSISWFRGVDGGSGRCVFNGRLLRASLGDTERVLCGVARYWRRKVYMACFQF